VNPTERPRLGSVLRRGWRRRCPQCGEGPLFRKWIEAHERCSACDLLFQRNYGDTWIFVILMDRIPILAGIIAVYFGYKSTSPWMATAFFAALALPLLLTMRERQGIALALDYLARVHFPDPSDEIHGGQRMPDRSLR
jgi:uncharacterized protein (DUF983 family)